MLKAYLAIFSHCIKISRDDVHDRVIDIEIGEKFDFVLKIAKEMIHLFYLDV